VLTNAAYNPAARTLENPPHTHTKPHTPTANMVSVARLLSGVCVTLVAGLLLQRPWTTAAYDNGLALRPPLGWQTWCSVGPCGTDHCFDSQV